MVKVRYVGVTDPRTASEALRPAWNRLAALTTHCRPYSADHHVLSAALTALETAALQSCRLVDPR
jgi:hypothetical protein